MPSDIGFPGILEPRVARRRVVHVELRKSDCDRRAHHRYRFDSEDAPTIRLRLKVEINSRERFTVYGLRQVPFAVSSRWFERSCQICSYELDELAGTKLRALYQRKQGGTCSTWRPRWGNPGSIRRASSRRSPNTRAGAATRSPAPSSRRTSP